MQTWPKSEHIAVAFILLQALTVASISFAASDPVTIGPIKLVEVVTDSNVELAVPIKIAKGYHIQANPPSEPRYVATTLELKQVPGFTLGMPTYPKAETYKLRGGKGELSVYSGHFAIKVPAQITADAQVGNHLISGTLRYQACDDKNCLFPKTQELNIPVRVLVKKVKHE